MMLYFFMIVSLYTLVAAEQEMPRFVLIKPLFAGIPAQSAVRTEVVPQVYSAYPSVVSDFSEALPRAKRLCVGQPIMFLCVPAYIQDAQSNAIAQAQGVYLAQHSVGQRVIVGTPTPSIVGGMCRTVVIAGVHYDKCLHLVV